ncbi:MAG: ferritin [Spirochaetaceae bacterium]|nr:MAG: ferritin [Spirochaetaceae bacterium]
MNEDVKKALNKQINMEMFSSYLYLSMSADFLDKNLSGFAQWMKIQADEETEHAMKIFHYLGERGARIELEAIDAPKKSWNSPLEAFSEAYAHEQKVTASIGKIVDLAREKKDHATDNFLQWFVKEQVEEEANADANVKKIGMVKENAGALYMLDRELGSRKGD